MKTHLDWSGYDTYGIGDAYSGIPARGGNYAKAVAVCMHNRECQREGRAHVPELLASPTIPLIPPRRGSRPSRRL